MVMTCCAQNGFAAWDNMLKDAGDLLNKSGLNKSADKPSSSQGSVLSDGKISSGLKEALDVGVKKAISLLGAKDGFLKDKVVSIPLPEKMQKIGKFMRKVGQEKKVDEFVTSMNRAAENATPKVAGIFADSISKMSLEDGRKILSGPETAATDYFKEKTSADLLNLIKPQINKSMGDTQVVQYYQSMVKMVKKYDSFGLMKSYLGDKSDIDEYVSNKTMDGLFSKIGEQEKLIRANPAARTTSLLKDVFGSVMSGSK